MHTFHIEFTTHGTHQVVVKGSTSSLLEVVFKVSRRLFEILWQIIFDSNPASSVGSVFDRQFTIVRLPKRSDRNHAAFGREVFCRNNGQQIDRRNRDENQVKDDDNDFQLRHKGNEQ